MQINTEQMPLAWLVADGATPQADSEGDKLLDTPHLSWVVLNAHVIRDKKIVQSVVYPKKWTQKTLSIRIPNI